ncbi:unnamed protein product [Caenorhabditis auriculariae]|uniref:7TM GPCR serpentine receptor class x (Srx) domain-containing protein n=1 Tax=Caenorhabditis auriculariae TaxID=2777116 RepID=A0A8S1GS78_9PELO|nr:unnamed protein product [Caenorhabditis auriculariae]
MKAVILLLLGLNEIHFAMGISPCVDHNEKKMHPELNSLFAFMFWNTLIFGLNVLVFLYLRKRVAPLVNDIILSSCAIFDNILLQQIPDKVRKNLGCPPRIVRSKEPKGSKGGKTSKESKNSKKSKKSTDKSKTPKSTGTKSTDTKSSNKKSSKKTEGPHSDDYFGVK